MKLKVISVYDKKTATFAEPFVVRHVGDAIRQWDIVRKNPENKYGKNPEDFDLYQLSEYCDQTGKFEDLSPATQLASGV